MGLHWMGHETERAQQEEVKKNLSVHIGFTCNLCKQWGWRTSHCLISSAVLMFPIHALICTSLLPLAQFGRNRKWSTSWCSPCGTLLTTALSAKQNYKDIITNNICVTDGDQLPLLKRDISMDNRKHLWSNIGAMWWLPGPLGQAGNALKWKGWMCVFGGEGGGGWGMLRRSVGGTECCQGKG